MVTGRREELGALGCSEAVDTASGRPHCSSTGFAFSMTFREHEPSREGLTDLHWDGAQPVEKTSVVVLDWTS